MDKFDRKEAFRRKVRNKRKVRVHFELDFWGQELYFCFGDFFDVLWKYLQYLKEVLRKWKLGSREKVELLTSLSFFPLKKCSYLLVQSYRELSL